MNWRKLELSEIMPGARLLVKAVNENGVEKYFCGTFKKRNSGFYIHSDQASYHYFRSGITYYYVNLREIK